MGTAGPAMAAKRTGGLRMRQGDFSVSYPGLRDAAARKERLSLPIGMAAFILFCLLFVIEDAPLSAMSLGSHMIVGAGLGHELADGPGGAFLVGVASHAVLDAIPHYDGSGWFQNLTLIAGILVTRDLYNRSGQDPRVLWGAVGGMVPDIEHFLASRGIIKRGQKIFPSHIGIIRQPSAPEDAGTVLELGVNGLALVFLF